MNDYEPTKQDKVIAWIMLAMIVFTVGFIWRIWPTDASNQVTVERVDEEFICPLYPVSLCYEGLHEK